MDTVTVQVVDSIQLRALDSIVRHAVDSVKATFVDSARAIVREETAFDWMNDLIWPALLAGIVGFLLWLIQHWIEKRRVQRAEREQFAKVWGLALYELCEAIGRSLSFAEKFSGGSVSLGVLYFAKTVASDYFKAYSTLSVAEKMHWMYGMLNQVQENLATSRVHDEARTEGGLVYTGAAAGFVKDHGPALVLKFNCCLIEWRTFCKKHKISIASDLDLIKQPSGALPEDDGSS